MKAEITAPNTPTDFQMSLPITLVRDASNVGIDTVLGYDMAAPTKKKSYAYASKLQKNKTKNITQKQNKKGLQLYFALESFTFTYMAKKEFKLITNHKRLLFFFKGRSTNFSSCKIATSNTISVQLYIGILIYNQNGKRKWKIS